MAFFAQSQKNYQDFLFAYCERGLGIWHSGSCGAEGLQEAGVQRPLLLYGRADLLQRLSVLRRGARRLQLGRGQAFAPCLFKCFLFLKRSEKGTKYTYLCAYVQIHMCVKFFFCLCIPQFKLWELYLFLTGLYLGVLVVPAVAWDWREREREREREGKKAEFSRL